MAFTHVKQRSLSGPGEWSGTLSEVKTSDGLIIGDIGYESGGVYMYNGSAWVLTISPTGAASVDVANGAILAAIWAGAGTTSAPDPELYSEGQIGANAGGASAGLTYHVVGAVGAKAWITTGATVKNLYGGA